jgi:glycerate-2-kinase
VNGTPADTTREILLAAIRAVNPHDLTAKALHQWGGKFERGSVELIAAGKAASAMVRGASDALGPMLRGGIAIGPDRESGAIDGVRAFEGGHPMPNDEGANGARAASQLLAGGVHKSPVLVLISGGASSLMTLPAEGLSIDDVVVMSRALMAAGADIRELNCVRKHLDQLKGGLMARIARGTPIRALVLSDVIGDPLDVIGSGPLVPDPTTFDDAIRVLRERDVWDALPSAVRTHLLAGAQGLHPETPKPGDPCFMNVQIEIIGNNTLAVQGAAAEAQRQGLDVEILTTPAEGEARDAGDLFARAALERWALARGSGPRCLVGGGETTVTVTGNGIGGRNLEFAAAAAIVIDGAAGIAIGSLGTDGRDGPTDAAGAVVDGDTVVRARAAAMDLASHLRQNDTLRALDAAGAAVRTGPTGTNVADVYAAVIV